MSGDEHGPPVGPLGNAVDDLTSLVRRIGEISGETRSFGVETRARLVELERRSVRNFRLALGALALFGLLVLIGTGTLVSLLVIVSNQADENAEQGDAISDVLVRVQVDRERSIRDGCANRNADHATLLQLVREAKPGPAFVRRAEGVLGQADCDALVRASREAVGVPPAP